MQRQLLIFLSLAFCSNHLHIGADLGVDEGDCSGGSDALNKWLKVSQWSSNRPSLRENYALVAYRRSQKADSNSSNFHTPYARLLLHGGNAFYGSFSDSWIYSPGINSWALVTPPSNLGLRYGHSLTTLCETRVILFGGDPPHRQKVWLFDGTREKWLQLSVSPLLPSPAGRRKHSASAVFRKKSPCHCKESLFIYGGIINTTTHNETRDLWELHCLNDTDERNITYQWTFHGNGATTDINWPDLLSGHFSFSVKTDLYFIGKYTYYDGNKQKIAAGVWKLDTLTLTWSHYDTFSSMVHRDFQPGTGTFLQEFGLVLITSSRKSFMYDLKRKRETLLSLTFEKESGFSFPESEVPTAISVDKQVFMFAKQCFDGSCENFLAAWKVNLRAAIDGSNTKDLTLTSLPSPRLSPSTTDCFNAEPPPTVYGVGSSLIFKCAWSSNKHLLEDLPELGCGIPFEGPFWQLDFDSKRWMLYKPDRQIPFHLGAVSVFDSDNLVVFLGLWINNLKVHQIKNELWLYTVSLRVWTPMKQSKRRPKGHIYAALTPMKNGSLILYGSLDDTCCGQTEFWVLTPNLRTMTSTWHRPRRHSNQKILSTLFLNSNNFYRGSSTYAAVLNDHLLVYGGLLKDNISFCNHDIFFVNITDNSSPWKRFAANDSGCVQASNRLGGWLCLLCFKKFLRLHIAEEIGSFSNRGRKRKNFDYSRTNCKNVWISCSSQAEAVHSTSESRVCN